MTPIAGSSTGSEIFYNGSIFINGNGQPGTSYYTGTDINYNYASFGLGNPYATLFTNWYGLTGPGGFVFISTDRAQTTNRICASITNSGVVGTGNGVVTAGTFNASSDYRIKKDVMPIIDTVDDLRPVTYTNLNTSKKDFGLIAHELQEIYPFLVSGEKDGETHQSVNYIGLIALLIKEIQELKSRVKILE